jgi:hypothetical protein
MTVIVFVVIVAIVITGTVASTLWGYRVLKPYLKSPDGRKYILKGFAILTVLAFGGAAFVKFYVMSEPAYFEQGIEQLRTTKYIQNRIGGFSSYTFQESQLLQEPKSPADFQVEIHGDSLNLFLTCTMTRTKDSWHLAKIKEDSTSLKR